MGPHRGGTVGRLTRRRCFRAKQVHPLAAREVSRSDRGRRRTPRRPRAGGDKPLPYGTTGTGRRGRVFRHAGPSARTARSLPTEGREEPRGAGAKRCATDQARGRGRIRPSRAPVAKPDPSRSAQRRPRAGGDKPLPYGTGHNAGIPPSRSIRSHREESPDRREGGASRCGSGALRDGSGERSKAAPGRAARRWRSQIRRAARSDVYRNRCESHASTSSGWYPKGPGLPL